MQPPINITQDWLSAQAEINPDKPFLYTTDRDRAIPFAEMDKQVRLMCAKWQQVGIQAGDHVGLLMINFPLTIIQTLTAIRFGATLVPINVRLTGDEIDFQLKNAKCRWLLPYGSTDVLAELRDKGHHIAPIDTAKPDKNLPNHAVTLDLNNPFAIIHTSGTSGQPKGAVLTYNNFYQSTMSSAYRIGILPDDRWLCVLPLFHVGGLSIILRALLYGTAVELMPTAKFDVDAVNHALIHRPITLVSLVPTMLYRLLEARREAWNPKLRLVLLGGAAPSPELVQRCVEEGIPLSTTYGMTEATSQIATSTPDQVIRKPASVGKPLLFTQVRVISENDEDLSVNEVGEVIARGPTIMREYYNNPSATQRALKDGWLHTGDMGYLDEEGDLFIVQRRSDLIVSGGENVYPVEVENILRQHPSIKEAVVVGLADAEWGQKVSAAIQLENGETLTPDEIIAFARDHLAGYKIPREIRFVTDFPQTGSGKIQRPAVKALFDDNAER